MPETRDEWARIGDEMLLALRPHASADHTRIVLPGHVSAHGTESDALEAFARSFLLAAIRIKGENGADPRGHAEWYAEGLRHGPDIWPRPDRLGQSKVEACSIALALSWTRPWIWDRLGATEQRRIIDWLATVVGEDYPPINWVWFQIVVETFLREVGGPWSESDIRAGLSVHESLYRSGGWYSDGPERAFDHYNGWALHVYPLLWSSMPGALGDDDRRTVWKNRLTRYVDDALHLIGADGAPLIQGRSLIYRFAAAAPLWTEALTGTERPGLIRHACGRMLGHFVTHGAPDDRGLLTVGWHGEYPPMAQSYSGFGSPYWASKGMLGLLLPAEHPVWTAAARPLPVEHADFTRAIEVPGWHATGTRADGIVRVTNHGTDHATPGDKRGDSPLYAQLAYSTATFPVPPANQIALIEGGSRTHRNGFDRLSLLSSRAHTHWLTDIDQDAPDHGGGATGVPVEGPPVTVRSASSGPVEVRVAVVEQETTALLEFTGWPATDGYTSLVVPLLGVFSSAAETVASPSGQVTIPLVRTVAPPVPGRPYAVAVVLTRGTPPPLPRAEEQAGTVVLTWPDGRRERLG